jgi:hypothetical protein
LLFEYHLLFWEADFHKLKDKEALSRSHNDLSTNDGKERLRASASAELHDAQAGI